ncbi:MAG: LLM class flavin-dependent oxidoreductase [Balneolales bacterium]|nr:LLM class flavin-dependent oxidoreductase [Balneolales bacterium]
METELFTTISESIKSDSVQYLRELKRIAVQSEKYGYKGILVYSDNRLADPWVIAAFLLSETAQLIPMIALQPIYMHPFTVAKKISSIAFMHKRKVALNLVAGGYINDLKALGESMEHNRRYDRLIEYSEIIQKLLTTKEGVTYIGEFYQIQNLKLSPEMPEELLPDYYLSGSSDAAKQAAARLGAKLIQYPEPMDELKKNGADKTAIIEGIRIGVLARHNHEKAWKEAHNRFPATRIGQISHQLAKQTTDAVWHNKLSGLNSNGFSCNEKSAYWLGPFEHYHTFCPYLVGSYDEVAKAISYYLQAGCKTCIIDTPVSDVELHSTMQVFSRAQSYLEKTGLLQ